MTEAGTAIMAIGLLIVLSQGAMLLEEGRAYLARAYPDPAKAKAAAALVAGPAFLATCGALLLIATIGVDPDDGIQTILARVGVIFLAAAAMHLGAFVLFSKDRAETEHIEETEERLHRQAGS